MMEILWNVFEITINIFQGFILIYFQYAYLGCKEKRNKTRDCIFYSLFLALAITIVNCTTIFEHIYVIFYISIMLLYDVRKLNGSLLKKIFSVIFSATLISVATALVCNFTAALFQTDVYSILSEKGITRFIAIITAQLVLSYLIIISLKILGKDIAKDSIITTYEWVLISSVLIISVLVGVILNLVSMEMISLSGRVYIIAAFLGMVGLNIAVSYFVVDLGKKNKAVSENAYLKLEREYSRQYIQDIDREYETIRKLRHDYKNSFSTLYSLITDGNEEQALQYIENSIGQINNAEVLVKTNNGIVNAVVNSKLSVAKAYGIVVTYMSVANFDGIEDIDLCRLLSNMLDNAIYACIKSNKQVKRIYLNIAADEYKYLFVLKNTVDEPVMEKNPSLISSKTKEGDHGLGVNIIKDIAKKYDGKADFYDEDGEFCCTIILRKSVADICEK